MFSILLFNSDHRAFEFTAVAEVFQSEIGFREVRFDEPGGAAIEAVYEEPNDRTIIRLSGDRDRISLSGSTDAVLGAALVLQRRLATPLRMVDTVYSFDLVFSGLSSTEELQLAIERSRTS